RELPDVPEKVWTGVDTEGHEIASPSPAQLGDFKLPIRVTFEDADPKEDPLKKGEYPFNPAPGSEKDDPMRKRLAVRVSPIMKFRIINPLRFLKTFGSEEEALRQLQDKVTTQVTAALQVGTYARALANIEGVGQM